ncbi:iron-sulfur cluster binding protein [Plesiocystis pacifica SIR-1]|uniref:Iron-sulfur cluster binding protein n=1 Tax=Plesiocystis pacifica SIR-1 TaxID=391625 RepID=A6FXL0_9BACT|nr:4Fe-4S binding protein [Plesiocystis pacifica]EDM81598.1 iron-sulfur cluster binding protein [Plesiocystis pacifica SIR-1]
MKTFMLTLLAGGARNAMLDSMLEAFDSEVFELEKLIHPAADAAPRNTFTSEVPQAEHSIMRMSVRQRLSVGPTMLKLMREMNGSSRYYSQTFEPTQVEASAEDFAGIEAVAKEQGATAVGYVHVPDHAIFGGKAIPHRQAILYTVPMSKAILDTAPSFEAFREVAGCYLKLAQIGNALTKMLRGRGHAAYPGTALGGLSDYTQLAELAGLGTIGYHGLLISPTDGALLRINAIYTSIENIPAPPEPPGWIRDFCAMCRKCVRQCPVDAIHPEPVVLDSGRVQCIDSAACLDYFDRNFGCAVCADVCPFSQKGFDLLAARFKGNPDAPSYAVSGSGLAGE